MEPLQSLKLIQHCLAILVPPRFQHFLRHHLDLLHTDNVRGNNLLLAGPATQLIVELAECILQQNTVVILVIEAFIVEAAVEGHVVLALAKVFVLLMCLTKMVQLSMVL